MRGTTRILSTGTGVQPLGVRGDPLHHAEEQIRAVVRRRLGDRHYHVLAEPEPHERSGRIDWYSDLDGPVEPLNGLRPDVRDRVRADIDTLLDDIDRLGQSLQGSASEDSRYAGELLRLAARRPTDEYLFLVGGQPVVACWGYDVLATRAALPAIFEPPVVARPTMPPPPPALSPPAPLPLAASAPAVPPPLPVAPPLPPPPLPIAAAPAAASLFGRRRLLVALLPLLLLASGLWFMTREGETATCFATQRRQAIVLVLDTSNSMALPADLARQEADAVEEGVERGDPRALQRFQQLIRQSGRKRFDDARDAAIQLMKAAPDAAEVGLVSFVRTCDAQVDVRPARGARGEVIRELQAAAPRSGTPLAAAMRLAADELATGPVSDAEQTMVILTDGRESCRGDPCAEARALKSRLPKAVVHVVDVTGRSGLQCVAEVTGGTMATARTADQLRAAIRQVQTTICK